MDPSPDGRSRPIVAYAISANNWVPYPAPRDSVRIRAASTNGRWACWAEAPLRLTPTPAVLANSAKSVSRGSPDAGRSDRAARGAQTWSDSPRARRGGGPRLIKRGWGDRGEPVTIL